MTSRSNRDATRVTLSDLLRDEASRRGIPPTRGHLQDLGNSLRREFGASVLVDRVLSHYTEPHGLKLVIDGVRNPAEVLAIRKRGGLIVGLTRRQVMDTDDGRRIALQRESDPQEPVWGQRVSDAMTMVATTIRNDGSLQELLNRIVVAIENTATSAVPSGGALPAD